MQYLYNFIHQSCKIVGVKLALMRRFAGVKYDFMPCQDSRSQNVVVVAETKLQWGM